MKKIFFVIILFLLAGSIFAETVTLPDGTVAEVEDVEKYKSDEIKAETYILRGNTKILRKTRIRKTFTVTENGIN